MSLKTNLETVFAAIAGRDKLLLTLITGSSTIENLAALTTTEKGNLVAALNEVRAVAVAASGGAGINDAAPSTTTAYSSTKTEALVSSAVAALVDGAPTALDTLKELADELASDQVVVDGILAAIALRVRVDAVQSFTAPQQAQARSNIGAVASADIGDPETNFLAVYQAALV